MPKVMLNHAEGDGAQGEEVTEPCGVHCLDMNRNHLTPIHTNHAEGEHPLDTIHGAT